MNTKSLRHPIALILFLASGCLAGAAETNSALPDPLLQDGRKVLTKEHWFSQRRPELQELFQKNMYGYLPPAAAIAPQIQRVDTHFFGGKATLKLVRINFTQTNLPGIDLMLVTPNQKKPAPVFVGLNFSGNHALVTDRQVPPPTSWINGKAPAVVDHRATEAGRGQEVENWEVEQTIARGYALASFYYGDIEPDQPGATNGVRALLSVNRNIPEGSRWGAVAAWAWGLERVVDYLETDKDIDPRRIAAVGHSRLGKAVLLAGAFDERIAVVFPHQAGCGGTAPSRSTTGESVAKINERFPHWFCGEFKKFNTQTERLPFDQNGMIALCAPRPVLVSAGAEDAWSNPAGQFECAKAASPVYQLVRGEGLAAVSLPEPGKLIDSPLGFFIRPGRHSMTRVDWNAFLDFADRNLK